MSVMLRRTANSKERAGVEWMRVNNRGQDKNVSLLLLGKIAVVKGAHSRNGNQQHQLHLE